MNVRLVMVFLAIAVTMAAAFPDDQSPQAVEKWYKRLPYAKQKLTKLHFYFHDIMSGNHPTSVEVARAKNISSTATTYFSVTSVFDDPLTVGPELDSKRIGYGQGIYVPASQEELSLLFTFNFVFTDGEFKGSTLSVLGRNTLGLKYREMPIIGGSGVFRLATGTAVTSTQMVNATTLDGIAEYTLMVLHYDI